MITGFCGVKEDDILDFKGIIICGCDIGKRKIIEVVRGKKNKYISKIDIENLFLAQRIERINLNFDFGH